MESLVVLAVLVGFSLLSAGLYRLMERSLRRKRERDAKLQALVVKDEGSAEARMLATEALSDLDPDMRLLGQAEFIEDVDRLTDLFTNRLLPVGARAVALRRMALRAPASRAGAVLEFVLSLEARATVGPEIQRAAIEEVGRLRHRPAAARVREFLDESDPATVEAAVHALGFIGDASVEPRLIGLLSLEVPALQHAAAQALGRIGTVAAVEPLHAMARAGGDGKDIALGAIRAIQARKGGVQEGQLSVARTIAEGSLSLGSDEGQLSVASPAPGEVDEVEFEVPLTGPQTNLRRTGR